MPNTATHTCTQCGKVFDLSQGGICLVCNKPYCLAHLSRQDLFSGRQICVEDKAREKQGLSSAPRTKDNSKPKSSVSVPVAVAPQVHTCAKCGKEFPINRGGICEECHQPFCMEHLSKAELFLSHQICIEDKQRLSAGHRTAGARA